MRSMSRSQWRLVGFAATAVILVFTLACIDRPMKNAKPAPNLGSVISLPQSAERDVDLLFIVDNSGSMAEEQAMLQAQFSALMTQLKSMTGGLPNVHIGVTSTDLGTGTFNVPLCTEVGGDAGRLLKGSCANPTGVNYVIDVEPTSCEITKNTSGGVVTCSADTCVQANCDAVEAGTTLVDDDGGCPRCRNYSGQALEDVFSCMAGLGTGGCGFEQQLESAKKALDNNPANAGFIRENAFLGVIWITDEDDCSASNPQLYDNTQTDIGSTLGPLTSFRCFEFGITCNVNGRMTGPRDNCTPREDAGALLYPVQGYIDFLTALKDPQMLVVAAIAGPVNGFAVTVGVNDKSQPELQPSCTSAGGAAVAGIRMYQVVEAFNEPEDMTWAYTSICSSTFTTALEGIGRKIKDMMEFQCLPSPLKGCPDPGFEYGVPGDSQTCNDNCVANCTVTDIFNRGVQGLETKSTVPPCLEVCPTGPCPGNTDRTVAYNNAHPTERDASLPVTACWHINYQENCPDSNFAEMIISRKADPPPRSFSEVACVQIAQDEQLCNDGVDNDEDCLVDLEDPDCQ